MKSARLDRPFNTRHRTTDIETAILTPFCEEKAYGLLRALSLDEILYDDVREFGDLNAYPHAFETDMDLLLWLCAMTAESETGRALLEDAQDEGWTVKFDDLGQEGYAIDAEGGAVIIDHYGFKAPALGKSPFFRHVVLMNFVRLLRDLWHERTVIDLSSYRPDALILIERARMADRETVAILTAWEMREAGHHDVWRSLLSAGESDMAGVFVRAAEADPHAFEDGSILARTFCQWYGQADRVAACDHGALEDMDAALENSPYEKPFGKNGVTGAVIESLAGLPFGESYLSGMGKNICIDPCFVSMDDPINEMHLFQVTYDNNIVRVEGVPFRDASLAELIFPAAKVRV